VKRQEKKKIKQKVDKHHHEITVWRFAFAGVVPVRRFDCECCRGGIAFAFGSVPLCVGTPVHGLGGSRYRDDGPARESEDGCDCECSGGGGLCSLCEYCRGRNDWDWCCRRGVGVGMLARRGSPPLCGDLCSEPVVGGDDVWRYSGLAFRCEEPLRLPSAPPLLPLTTFTFSRLELGEPDKRPLEELGDPCCRGYCCIMNGGVGGSKGMSIMTNAGTGIICICIGIMGKGGTGGTMLFRLLLLPVHEGYNVPRSPPRLLLELLCDMDEWRLVRLAAAATAALTSSEDEGVSCEECTDGERVPGSGGKLSTLVGVWTLGGRELPGE